MNRKIGVIYSYALMFVEVFSAMLFTPFLIRMLGSSSYGVYQLVSSITAYLALLDLGIGNAIVRYVSKYRVENNLKKQKEFLGIATVYYLIIAAIAFIAGLVIIVVFPQAFAKGLTASEIELARKLLIVTVMNSAVTLGTSAFVMTLVAYERFSASKGMMIVFTILKMLLSFVALKLGFGALGVVVVYFLANVLTRAFYVCYVLFNIKIIPSFKNFDFSFVKETVSYSSFILLQMIATQINAMTDTVLLGIVARNSSVIIAIYGVGAQIIQYFKTIGSHVNGVLMPGVVRLVENGADSKTLQNEMVRIGRILFMMLGLIYTAFAVYGEDFIVLWAGKEYKQAYFVALAILAPTMLLNIQSIANQILWAMNKHKMQAVIQIISAVLNIFLTAFLIKWNPLKGAVLGTIIALCLGDAILMNYMFKKHIGIKLIEYFRGLFKGVLPALLISAVVGTAIKFLTSAYSGWVFWAIKCAIMVAVYGICMLLFGMNTYEKNLIFEPVKKILKKAHIVK